MLKNLRLPAALLCMALAAFTGALFTPAQSWGDWLLVSIAITAIVSSVVITLWVQVQDERS